jgi:DNA-binding CsgD family transcriptional regulator
VQATRSAASVPLGAFAALLPADARSDDLFVLMERCAAALSTRANGRRLVLGVDDAQWLDPTSAALVLRMAGTGAAFVVVTVRTGEQCPDAVVSLWKDAGAERVDLSTLSATDVERLVEGIVGGPVELGVRRWVADVSRGNALYARELVAGAVADEALREVDGLWRMPARPPVSASLTELVSAGISDLDRDERRALELVALGEPLVLAELTSLVDAESLLALEERGVVLVAGLGSDNEVRLGHPIYGEVIRAGLPPLRAREARLALVAMLQTRAALDPGDLLRIVRWLLDAGEPVGADRALDAARAAILGGDPELAATLATVALPEYGIAAALLLARAYIVLSRFDDAEAVLIEIEPQLSTQEQALEYLERRSETLHWGLKRPVELRDLLDRAQDWWPDAGWRRRLEPLRVRLASFEDLGLSLAESTTLMESDRSEDSDHERVAAVHVANLFYSGQTTAALKLARDISPTLPLRGLSDATAVALWGRVTVETGEGWSELEQWMAAALAEGIRLSDPATSGQAAYWLAQLRFLAGRYRDAGGLLAEAELQLERHDPVALLPTATALQVEVACMIGDRELAQAALARCQRRLGSAEPLAHQAPYMIRAQAWAAHLDGDMGGAQRLLLDGANRFSASPVHRARVTYEALRVGASAQQLAPALDELRGRCDARLVWAYGEHAAGLAADDGKALIDVCDRMVSFGAVRYAAEAAANAADAFMRAGRQDSARRATTRSRSLVPEGQGAQAPVIVELDPDGVSLTAREAQLVKLASRGLSNAQIAEQLVVSIRTVESHLYRAMQKLGVSDRREL